MNQSSNQPEKTRIIIADSNRRFTQRLALELDAVCLLTDDVLLVGDNVATFKPDLVVVSQTLISDTLARLIRARGLPHVQTIVLLTNAGPPPPSISGLVDGFIWREVGVKGLVGYIKQAARRKGSLSRMRAVRGIDQ